MPILLYGLEACALTKADIKSLNFVLNRFFIKLFKTNNVQIIMACRENFGFRLPSILIASRTKKLESSRCFLEYKCKYLSYYFSEIK